MAAINVCVDYGNSSAKVGIFENHELREKLVFAKAEELKNFLQQSDAEGFIISSVSHDASEVSSWAMRAKRKFILHHTLPLPIINKYGTPSTLGVDRLAGVCGAQQLFPGKKCLVIDAGTCITYDIVNSDRHFLGGGISPGLTMRFQAVNTFTKKLPLVGVADDVKLIGENTEQCIQSGVINGLLEEVDGIISRYQYKFADLRVILCGGDGQFFENKLKASIFAVPELVLSGLNSILIYNVSL
jgi:type III pantothenate kinase